MKVGIVGYRNFTNYEVLEKNILDLNLDITTIVSGGCEGTDKLAEQFAKKHNIPTIIHYPDWTMYGSKAGPIRNSKIVNDSEYIIAFVSPKSRGTFDTINKAKKNKIGITIYNI